MLDCDLRPSIGGQVPRRKATRIGLAAAVAMGLASVSSATTYTYTPTNNGTGPDDWSGGTASHWSATPVSSNGTTLVFEGTNTTVLASGLTDTNTNDISGNFVLLDLTLQGTGPSSGTGATINIDGNPLEIQGTSGASPLVSLNALAGTEGLTYNINTNIVLDSTAGGAASSAADAFSGNGTATFNFNGTISGSGALFKTGSSTITLTNVETFTGVTTVAQGTLVLGGFNAGLTSSSINVWGGALQFNSNSGNYSQAVGRAPSVTLAGGTLSIFGSAAGNTYDQVSNALTIGVGGSTLTLSPNSATQATFNAGSLAESFGGTLLLRGPNGQFGIYAGQPGQSNVTFSNTPTLVGSGSVGTPTVGIIPYMVGDLSLTGTGTDFVTYDSSDGLRILTSSEYATTFPDGDQTGVNAKLSSALTINSATTLNSLLLATGGGVSGTGTLTISSGALLSTGSTTSVSNPIAFGSAPAILTAAGGSSATLSGAISGSAGLVKAGIGTVTLGATNTYTGNAIINNGTLTIAANNALPAAGTLTIGAYGNAATVNVNANQTVSNIDFMTNSPSVTNKVVIASGDTLTVSSTSSSNGLELGFVTAVDAATTLATFSGSGTLTVSDSAGLFEVGEANTNQNNVANSATLNLSALGAFNATVSKFGVSFGSGLNATMQMSNGSNNITATTVDFGNSNNGNGGSAVVVTLGTGTNVIKTNTIDIGESKSVSTVAFSSQTAGSPGTLTLSGNTSTNNMNLGWTNGTGTSATPSGTLNLYGHQVNVTVNALVMGKRDGTGTGGATGTIDFDTGTFTVTSIDLGHNTQASTGTAAGTINVNGGTFTVASGGSFSMATAASGAGAATGTLNLTGGSFVSGASIIKGGTNANDTATIVLNGGTLDMQNNAIGSTNLINTLTFESGTLQNVSQINAGAALVKTGTGVLILNGSNAYTGGTNVNAGTVLANSTNTTNGAAGSGVVTVASGAKLAGGTAAGFGQIMGGVTVNSGATISAGNGTNTTGGLTIGGTSTFTGGTGSAGSGTTYTWAINDAIGTAGNVDGWDQLAMSTFVLNQSNGSLVAVQPISIGNGTAGAAMANFNPSQNYTWAIATASPGSFAAGTNNVAANFALDAPSLSSFASENGATGTFALDVSNNGGELDMVYYAPTPEPGALSLAVLGAGTLLLRRRRRLRSA